MPPKYQPGAQKRKEKQRETALIQNQAGGINKCFNSNKRRNREEIEESLVIEDQQNQNENEEVREIVDLNESNYEAVNVDELHDNEGETESINVHELSENLEDGTQSDKMNQTKGSTLNLEDPRNWNMRLKTQQTIDYSVQLQNYKERHHWRQVLTRIIPIVKTLAKNNLAFQGDDEKLYVENNGLFLQMIEMIAEFDPIMEEHVRRAQAREIQYTCLEPKIQNELTLTLANEVRSAIIAKVKHAKYFSIILDCTSDASHEEQMSLVLRCVDDSTDMPKVEEYWVEFLKADDISRLGLSIELENVLTRLGLDIDDVRGQGYDGKANMSGRYKGVQKRILEMNPRAFYSLYGCHSLNLAIADVVECCPKAKSFFGVVQRIYTLFSTSPERWKFFKDMVPGLTLMPLSQTRWEGHVESVKAIKEQTMQIRDALLDLAERSEDFKTMSEAEALAMYDLENFEFLLGMVIWYKLLYAINNVSKFLESENMNIGIAIDLLQGLIAFLDEYREYEFDSAIGEAKQLANEMGIEPKFQKKHIIRRKKQFDESGSHDVTLSGEECFRVEYFLFIIDQVRSFIQVRFEQFKQYEETFGFLLNLDKLKSEPLTSLRKFCEKLEQFLSHDGCSDINSEELCSELMVMRHYLTSERTAIEVLCYLAKLDGLFPNTYIAYKILLTIPVTVASAGRSSSKLMLTKNYLRSTMSQDSLNGLAMLSIEKEMVEQLDYTDLINNFAFKMVR